MALPMLSAIFDGFDDGSGESITPLVVGIAFPRKEVAHNCSHSIVRWQGQPLEVAEQPMGGEPSSHSAAQFERDLTSQFVGLDDFAADVLRYRSHIHKAALAFLSVA